MANTALRKISALVITAAIVAGASGGAQAQCSGRVQTGSGDSAVALAQKCNTTVQKLRLANPGLDTGKPLSGQIVRIPGAGNRPLIPDALNFVAPSVFPPIEPNRPSLLD